MYIAPPCSNATVLDIYMSVNTMPWFAFPIKIAPPVMASHIAIVTFVITNIPFIDEVPSVKATPLPK